MRKMILIILCIIPTLSGCGSKQNFQSADRGIAVTSLTEEGAWCWFADPRAVHYENESGTINSTYIGYIDVHGSIKATQIDHLHNRTNEVLIRSWFQPDDHNNPTFLVLPDERIMIFYSRHTDEPCFYYRVSREPGDITTLGNEMRLVTDHNTTYPSPFILSNDPEHIYLCWRGINWHPTIARLTLPDAENKVTFDWGPYQIVRSLKGAPGVRPYAKYASNGKDRIYLAYTTTHPDNQSENWIYLNCFDIHSRELSDIRGEKLSLIGSSPLHEVDITPQYRKQHPFAVVDNTPLRNWIWELGLDQQEHPVIAMVSINASKTSHDYYHVRWNGSKWIKTFLSNAGGHFHQSPDIEKCYSGGMTIDKDDPQVIYGSVPVEGKYGRIYELVQFTVSPDGGERNAVQLTFNSPVNNIRPYAIDGLKATESLVWMQGDYYDWMVSAERPQGYPTVIRSNISVPVDNMKPESGLRLQKRPGEVVADDSITLSVSPANLFTIALTLSPDTQSCYGVILQFAGLTYGIASDGRPVLCLQSGKKGYHSTNVLGNSDSWQQKNRGTNGQWYLPEMFTSFQLVITYDQQVLRTYINGLIDQSVAMDRLSLSDIALGGFAGSVDDLNIYDRALSQDEIKAISVQ